MNRIGRCFHFIQETSVKNEINFFCSSSRAMRGANAYLYLQNARQIMGFGFCRERVLLGCIPPNPLHSNKRGTEVLDMGFLSNGIFGGFNFGLSLVSLKFLELSQVSTVRPFTHAVSEGHTLSREWLVQLWLAGKKRNRSKHKRLHAHVQRNPVDSELETHYSSFTLSQHSPEAQSVGLEGAPFHEPPLSQPIGGVLMPTCPEEENRYAIMDPSCSRTPVGFIREQSNIFMRQLLRTRRYFVALITDAMGNELFRVRRPPWLINSTIYVDIDGKEMGVVHRRWHLWRRIYDLYLGKKQFAAVENAGFWDWTFTLKDENGKTLAEIDRDWRGFGFEMFTDAGQYVIRFGDIDSSTKTGLAAQIQELEVSRPLTLLERAVTVALAVSLDNDYFSRHSHWGIPIIPFWGE